MSGLIQEIQRDAMNETIKVSSILRKVRSAASKLGLKDIGQWVEYELNGYPSLKELPDYRQITGSPQAFNPFRGWIPIQMSTDKDQNMVSYCALTEPLAALETLLENRSKGFFQVPMPSGIIRLLNSQLNVDFGTMSNHISAGQVTAIVERVRNMVLDWALELERSGVTGSGLSFSPEERSAAQASGTTINIGTIGAFAGNIGQGNISGPINLDQSQRTKFFEVIEKIRNAIPDLERDGADKERLEKSLDAIHEEIQKSGPKKNRVSSLLDDAKSALIGAAGSLTAEGAIALINSAQQMLV